MTSRPRELTVSVCSLLITFMTFAASAEPETFQIDPDHSMIVFRVKHARVSYTYGRFNSPKGTFVIDQANPTGNTFNVQVATDNVYTGNRARDYHLTSPDFFNARQFRVISFQSSSVTKTADKQYEITGKLSLHGVEKEIKVVLEETGRDESRENILMGFEGTFMIKRSDFGMSGMIGPVGDEVTLIISLEGIHKLT